MLAAAVHMLLGHGNILRPYIDMFFASASYVYSSDDKFLVHIGEPLFGVEGSD